MWFGRETDTVCLGFVPWDEPTHETIWHAFPFNSIDMRQYDVRQYDVHSHSTQSTLSFVALRKLYNNEKKESILHPVPKEFPPSWWLSCVWYFWDFLEEFFFFSRFPIIPFPFRRIRHIAARQGWGQCWCHIVGFCHILTWFTWFAFIRMLFSWLE